MEVVSENGETVFYTETRRFGEDTAHKEPAVLFQRFLKPGQSETIRITVSKPDKYPEGVNPNCITNIFWDRTLGYGPRDYVVTDTIKFTITGGHDEPVREFQQYDRCAAALP